MRPSIAGATGHPIIGSFEPILTCAIFHEKLSDQQRQIEPSYSRVKQALQGADCSASVADPGRGSLSQSNGQKPFKPQTTDLTPECP